MIVTHLELQDFRSYPSVSLDFVPDTNVVTGPNGSGKTNLVEAIYYLSLGKSWRTNDTSALIRRGASFALVRADVREDELHRRIEILITPQGRKISLNGKAIRRLSELSRLVNVVLFSPEDTSIFKGSPSERRNFLDVSLSKQSLDYFSLIGKYNRLLQERNAALKSQEPDKTYLEVLTDQLIEVSEPIAHYRGIYVDELNRVLSPVTSRLYGNKRIAALQYRPFIKNPDFKSAAKKAYHRAFESDLYHKVTSVGIHREDFSLLLEGKDIAVYGSQGENRLASIALKLTPYFLIENPAKKPLAVLDDIYSELDAFHAERLTELIQSLGQAFVTSAEATISGVATIDVAMHHATRRKENDGR